jgi:hypothetical protein
MLQSQFKGGPVLSQECYCMPCSAALCHGTTPRARSGQRTQLPRKPNDVASPHTELSRDVEYNRMKETTLNLIAAGPPAKGYILSTAWLNRTFLLHVDWVYLS